MAGLEGLVNQPLVVIAAAVQHDASRWPSKIMSLSTVETASWSPLSDPSRPEDW